jgi:hypothetical protein
LEDCRIGEEEAQIIATAPGSKRLQALTIAQDWSFDRDAAKALFASRRLQSLSFLRFSDIDVANDGVLALAATRGLGALRSLELRDCGCESDALQTLLQSPNLNNLVTLTVGDRELDFEMSPSLARAITRLPHLASLRLELRKCGAEARAILEDNDTVAWKLIETWDESTEQYRANRSPERSPPLDWAVDDRW